MVNNFDGCTESDDFVRKCMIVVVCPLSSYVKNRLGEATSLFIYPRLQPDGALIASERCFVKLYFIISVFFINFANEVVVNLFTNSNNQQEVLKFQPI